MSFARLHEEGTFVMPNAWDVGSARILTSLGFPAIATTSSGFAASLGRLDQMTTRDELVAHVRALTSAVAVPVSVDGENCFPDAPGGVTETVAGMAEAGAAGISIEDYDPGVGILARSRAVERVAAVSEEASRHGLVVTARAENHLYGVDDLADTIERLLAYRETGAQVLYAPGLVDRDQIATIVTEVAAPVNVLLLPDGPTVGELAALGVRRLSTGGSLAFAAYGALANAARELMVEGTSRYTAANLSRNDRSRAFG
ncbi:MAG: isocitrate lyase/phosphoenolpyruvate mutase family protein [Actinobacteria bacterium]|nr:isocitrate lyase/phosphoenolpyruvate mutase family protein [Actinomycetota bacterium]